MSWPTNCSISSGSASMSDELVVPFARAVFQFDMDTQLPPPDRAGYQALVDRCRFAPVCELQAAMAARGYLTADGWEIVDGWLAFEPVHEDDHEWAIVWVAIGTQDPEAAADILLTALAQIAKDSGHGQPGG